MSGRRARVPVVQSTADMEGDIGKCLAEPSLDLSPLSLTLLGGRGS